MQEEAQQRVRTTKMWQGLFTQSVPHSHVIYKLEKAFRWWLTSCKGIHMASRHTSKLPAMAEVSAFELRRVFSEHQKATWPDTGSPNTCMTTYARLKVVSSSRKSEMDVGGSQQFKAVPAQIMRHLRQKASGVLRSVPVDLLVKSSLLS